MRFVFAAAVAAVFSLSGIAAPNRITGPLDSRQMQALPGNTHRLASAQFDRGVADAALPMNYVVLLTKPSAAQQTDLDQLLRDRQNPSSPNFHAWLSPEQFADRFGLSLSDQSKIVSWLTGEGLTVHAPSRGRNWIAFSGNAGQISKTFHTSIHRYEVNGEMHFANATDPSVPAAMAGLVGGFTGLHDFRPKSQARLTGTPDFTSGNSHYLAPGDFSTIYDVAPLALAGYDGTGQSVAVVGQSDILASDISAFRSEFGLPASAPRQVLFGADPGFNFDEELEGNLDLEWTGALAPKATIYYVYATDAFNAMLYAVAENVAPVISVSYGTCENDSLPVFRSVAQQANAQGITIVAAAGDSGAAGCDVAGDLPLATHAGAVAFPASLPEVTGMGGTMFHEGSGAYWAAGNSTTGASALSYIPEVVWNETAPGSGLLAGGGGASASIAKPDWQTGPGVPSDGARDVPDLALSSAAAHDAYLITYQGSLYGVGGTSAAAPSLSGILALLNQYVVKQGVQKTAGLGNINPQLYRMAQSVPAAFHDIVSGNNDEPCLQGSPGCASGTYGYAAGPGYDQATGIGSVDANVLVTSWGQAVSPVSVTLTSSAAKVTVNDTVTVTATVTPSGQGGGTPTGMVNFLTLQQPLGSGTLTNVNGQQTVSVTIPAWQVGVGTSAVSAQYEGNAAFSAGGASIKIQATLPTTAGVAAIGAQVPGPVFAVQTGTQPPAWQAGIALQELAGVPAVLTGFTVDGQAEPLSQYFPSPDIPAGGTLGGSIVFTNLAVPAIKTFGFTGTDPSGSTWSRLVQVQFRGPVTEQFNFNLWATPLTIQQNTGAATNCQWQQQITLDETSGYEFYVVGLVKGSVDISNTIAAVFGTTRLAPWGSLQGTVCWNPAATPSSGLLDVIMADDVGDELFQELNVNFTGPASSAVQLSVSPASVALKPPVVSLFPVPQTLTVNLSDKTQPWTATVFPANRTTTWLTLSQYAGTGPATLTLQTNGAGFEPGVYRATIVLQSPNSVPQYVAVPVMFVNTATPNGPAVSSLGNALSFTAPTSPGMIVAVYGSQLASGIQSAATLPLGDSLSGTSATVNGYPAPLFYVSPTQLNIQVPYEVGAGPAVLGINNNGQVGGFQFQLSPAAPGIFTVNGSTYPTASAKQGAYATIFVTGTGELNQAQPSGIAVPAGTPASSLPLPLLPITVTVGGVPALIQFAGSTVGVVGLTQVNFVVPPTVAAGVQPVVVTAGGYPSSPANLTVTTP